MKIARYLATRLGASLIVLIGVSILIFGLARVIPGDPARIALGPEASQEQVEALRERLHLNEPIPVQYWEFLKELSGGDLGTSLYTNRAVVKDLVQFFPATFELALVAGLLMVVIGIPLGILAARFRGGSLDNASNLFSLLGVVTPSFVWAIFLMLIFAFWLELLPIAGRLNENTIAPPTVTGLFLIDSLIAGEFATFRDALRHILLPGLALGIAGVGQVARLTRANLVETYDRQYVEMSRAFNHTEWQIAFKYALRPGMIPTLTILGLNFAVLLGNAFLVEAVFGWPGMARYGVQTVLHKDLNGIVGTVLVIATLFLVVNMIVDLIVAYLDPRIRLQNRA